uniref:hypothetical protein n=1 Tax=Rhodococcus qingshengii TaxID=334542 RepID=UPI0020C66F04|nr:hypothetical protein [Rhodococcus qingshengii]
MVGRKPGRRSTNRPAKRIARVDVVEERLSPTVPSSEDKFIVVRRPPLCFVYKVTSTQSNYTKHTLGVNLRPLEDTILPVTLKFPAPMQEFASEPKGFGYHWQRLTYLFGLDDPATFSSLRDHLDAPDLAVADRYYGMCKSLAGYSILSGSGRMKLTSTTTDGWNIESDLPSHEAFAGFSATFRQIQNHKENASFVKTWNVLSKAAGGLGEAEATEVRAVLKSWKKARARLMEKMVATMICEDLQKDAPADAPKSFMGIVPDEIIQTYNYGDSLHWGERREQLASLTDDIYNVNFNKHACVVSMIQLSHFYFGFAELVNSALGYTKAIDAA